jgi:hypothetical protein
MLSRLGNQRRSIGRRELSGSGTRTTLFESFVLSTSRSMLREVWESGEKLGGREVLGEEVRGRFDVGLIRCCVCICGRDVGRYSVWARDR